MSCAMGCPSPVRAHGLCVMHYTRWLRWGDPFYVAPIEGRPLKGDVPTWDGVHKRLQRTRGRAREYACVDCGVPAQEWSYDHTDPAPLTHDGLLPYSLDLARYSPRCVRCHRAFDRLQAASP